MGGAWRGRRDGWKARAAAPWSGDLELGASQRGVVATRFQETHSIPPWLPKSSSRFVILCPCMRKCRVFSDTSPGNGAGRFVSIQTTKRTYITIPGVANTSLPYTQTAPRTLLCPSRTHTADIDIDCAVLPRLFGARHPIPLPRPQARRLSAHHTPMPTYSTSAHCMFCWYHIHVWHLD